ncbi:MMPL family transporter, partial [Rhodococcus erythropolis]
MVEARAQGASTTESIRIGTAHTGRIITAAALILIVVTGAFGLSDLVMMKYISYGMISALIIDATLIRMFLVPATMKLLGDDCWWAPAWMKRIQQRIGLGEPILDNELVLANVPQIAPVGAIAGPGQSRKIEATSRVMPPPPAPAAQPDSGPRVPDPLTEPIPLSEMAVKAPNTEAPAAEKPAPRRRLDIGSAASAPQNLIEAPVPNPSYRPQPNASDKRRNPTPAAPAERPIESWLSDLRAREQTPPASRPLPVVRTPSRTNGSAANGAVTNGSSTNGSSANGASANGASANGAGRNGASNGSATNGSTPTSVEATPQSPPPPIAPERRPTEPRVSDASD